MTDDDGEQNQVIETTTTMKTMKTKTRTKAKKDDICGMT